MEKNLLKKIITFSFVFSLVFFSSTVYANIDNTKDSIILSYTYAFEKPLITSVVTDNEAVTKIGIPGLSSYQIHNTSFLPFKDVFLLLPPKTKDISITIKAENQNYLDVSHNLFSESIDFNDFSEEGYKEIGVYTFRGYKILVCNLYPVRYDDIVQELSFFQNIEVTVKCTQEAGVEPLFRGSPQDKLEALHKIDNPEILDYYTDLTKTTVNAENYDLLIITDETLKDGYEPLRIMHNLQGIHTEIKTIQQIGSNDSTVIRDFIREQYTNYGIEYVLLGADHDVIPAVYLKSGGELIPSDIYYACLDGPYNYDGDEFWGESNDGEDGRDIDLIAEVYVGRACTDNLEEVGYFVNKTITYMNLDYEEKYLKHCLFAGERLVDPQTLTEIPGHGGAYLEELINESYANEYYTVGFSYDDCWVDRLYDCLWIPENPDSGEGWPKQEIIHRMNNGTHIINHVGHSWDYNNMKLVISDVDNLTNDQHFFVYTHGCWAGAFDNPGGFDCIAEHFTVKTSHGAFAGIWNTRIGWPEKGSGNGGETQRFHREFWDAIFSENIKTIGRAHYDSKEDVMPLVHDGLFRYCFYELTLFGDPTLELFIFDNRSIAPENPLRPEGETTGESNIKYTYTTSTIDPDDDQVLYLWDWGDGNFSEWIGPYNSNATIKTSHSWTVDGEYEIRVKAKDVHGDESNWSEPLGVIMPKNTQSYSIIHQVLKILAEHFPFILKVVSYLVF